MKRPPPHASIRFPIHPRGVSASKAARRLGVTEAAFAELQPRLFARGFPRPDPDTGCFDIKAVDAWMDQQYHLLAPSVPQQVSQDLQDALDAWIPEPPRRRRKV